MRHPCGPTAILVLAVLTAATPAAQQNQPIYPAYDGFLQNPDGSYTLSFAYFSHNANPVTVPPGQNNFFTPGPADRGQSTTFRPGHWRFQCVMVVGPDFDGKTRWTLTYAGTTTSTSENMLQSNWNLVEGAAELGKIDYAKAPRNTCLNRAPIVRVLGTTPNTPLTAARDERFSLFGSVSDEGLPRDGQLTASWRQISGPAKAAFENPNAARTHVSFSKAGIYVLELAASDSVLSDSTRITIVVK
jgi:hypothetical protein